VGHYGDLLITQLFLSLCHTSLVKTSAEDSRQGTETSKDLQVA